VQFKDLLQVIGTEQSIHIYIQDSRDIYQFNPSRIGGLKETIKEVYREWYVNRIIAIGNNELIVQLYEDEHIFE